MFRRILLVAVIAVIAILASLESWAEEGEVIICGKRSVGECLKAAEAARVEGDLKTASALYEEVCKGGHSGACNNIGQIKKKEMNGYPAAERFFKMSCDRGLAKGCLNLAAVHMDQKRFLEGLRIYEELCEYNVARGCYSVGVHESQSGTPARTRAFYRKACKLGEPEGCYNLAVQLDKSREDEKDPDKISSINKELETLLTSLCKNKHPRGCFNLAVFYKRSERTTEAKFYLDKAKGIWDTRCDGGDRTACSYLKFYLSRFERRID